MKVLVTGGRGFIGRALTRRLRADGHAAWTLDLQAAPDSRHVRADVRSFRSLEQLLEGQRFEVVYHLAAETGRWNGEAHYEALWTTNVVGTKHLIRLQERLKFRLIFVSSSEIYGDFEGTMLESVPDETPIRLLNDYAMTKWVAEQQIRNSMEMYGTETVVARLFNVYGPGEHFAPNRGVIARFIWCALHDQPYTVYQDHTRTFTFIDDAARTLARICERFTSGAVYNIGGDEPVAIADLSQRILGKLGKDDRLVTYASGEPFTTRHKRVDLSRATRDLGHQNRIDIEEGLDRTIAWARQAYSNPVQTTP